MGGHNGLVHAAYLAKAGKKVLLVERRAMVGGATVTEEMVPGFKYLPGAYLISLLRPQVIRELELARHGLEIMPLESTVVPLRDGNYFADWPDHDLTRPRKRSTASTPTSSLSTNRRKNRPPNSSSAKLTNG